MALVLLSISLISAAAIGYEILLMRLFSIVQWHHFAFMIISVALLGYGASGTFLTLARRWLEPRFLPAYAASAALFGLCSIAGFSIAQRVPFNPLEIIWDVRQLSYLSAVYLLLFVPFFCAASSIGLALMAFRERINLLYLFDLVGAGAGALGMVLLLFALPPAACLRCICAIPFWAAALAAAGSSRRWRWGAAPAFVAVGLSLSLCWPNGLVRLRLSEYKGLEMALEVPGARIVDERWGPLGLIDVVESPEVPFRFAPGVSLANTQEPPEQLGIFTDGDSLSAITRFDGRRGDLAYLDALPQALPYHLLVAPTVLILGSGGGSDVLMALAHDAKGIDAVELNPQVADLVEGTFAAFSGDLFAPGRARLHVAEGRGFVTRSRGLYDLIQVALIDSFAASAAGLSALSESYLYTVEALREYVAHLTPGGILSITRWVNIPPRDSLKLFATAVQALGEMGVSDPAERLVFIRGWETATLLVKGSDFTPAEIGTVRRFCEVRAFDIAAAPGLAPDEANRFHQLEEPYFSEGAAALLGAHRDEYIRRYKFHIAPATDDRPYFFHSFKWGTLAEIWRLKGSGGAPLMEWAYPVLVATLAQALAASVVLILLPLAALGWGASGRRARGTVLAYFAALGLGFLFIEIAFIQRFILFLWHPLYAIAVVLSSFLIFAGVGSGLSARLARRLGVDARIARPRAAAVAVAGIALISLAYLMILPALFSRLMWLPDAGRVIISALSIAPLALCMGMPFPLGLSHAGAADPRLIPWAWGINGCASVISPVLATLLAIHFGFMAVVALAVLLYAAAAAILLRMR